MPDDAPITFEQVKAIKFLLNQRFELEDISVLNSKEADILLPMLRRISDKRRKYFNNLVKITTHQLAVGTQEGLGIQLSALK